MIENAFPISTIYGELLTSCVSKDIYGSSKVWTRQKKKLNEKYVSFVAQILFTEIEIFMYGSSISRSFEVHKT